MRVIITGCRGQLGRQLISSFTDHVCLGLDLPEDDIASPAIRARVAAFRPDLIVHAAAMTDVDRCEQDPSLAYRVNVLGTQNIVLGAQDAGAAVMYVSTNEVFDGSRREAYWEWDAPSPISVYARSKAAGENIVRSLCTRFFIVRVAWLFGPGGSNFVTKILAGARKHGALRVAADEFGNPTYAPDLAVAMARLAASQHYGIVHLTNSGFCSRFDFAKEIARLAGMGEIPISPILSAEWPRPSKPPLHAILSDAVASSLGLSMRPWREALAEYVSTLPKEIS
jgi:dTDP-4-dehydrorhamnose reductase